MCISTTTATATTTATTTTTNTTMRHIPHSIPTDLTKCQWDRLPESRPAHNSITGTITDEKPRTH